MISRIEVKTVHSLILFPFGLQGSWIYPVHLWICAQVDIRDVLMYRLYLERSKSPRVHREPLLRITKARSPPFINY